MEMRNKTSALMVAVGGVGGSGTRVVAKLLSEMGIYIGSDLNASVDNVWFTLLFKYREMVGLDERSFWDLFSVFRSAMSGEGEVARLPSSIASRLMEMDRQDQHSPSWLLERVASLNEALQKRSRQRAIWGWKEPNTHIVLERLVPKLPELRYIHVARNGVDMAFSSNQNQLNLWGPTVLGKEFRSSPAGSLKYWCWVHRRMLGLMRLWPDQILLLNFEAFCSDPNWGSSRVAEFLGVNPQSVDLENFLKGVHVPSSIGRSLKCDLTQFDEDDLDFVASMGFDVR